MLLIAGCPMLAPLLGAERFPRPGPWRPADQPAEPAAACRVPALVCTALLLLISVARISVSSFHPFLYFRF